MIINKIINIKFVLKHIAKQDTFIIPNEQYKNNICHS